MVWEENHWQNCLRNLQGLLQSQLHIPFFTCILHRSAFPAPTSGHGPMWHGKTNPAFCSQLQTEPPQRVAINDMVIFLS